MNAATLRTRSLRHYWRTNAAVVMGVATAVAVLAGSLLVGESVRASLANLALERLGQVSESVTSQRFFREALAQDLTTQPAFKDRYQAASPLIVLQGSVSKPDGGQRAGDVLVYGVDARFFELNKRTTARARGPHRAPEPRPPRRAAGRDGRIAGDHGRRPPPTSPPAPSSDDATSPAPASASPQRGRCRESTLGEFTLRPTLRRCARSSCRSRRSSSTLGLDGRVNTVVVSDHRPGLKAGPRPVHPCPASSPTPPTWKTSACASAPCHNRGALALESASGLIDDETVATALRVARERNLEARPSLIHLANAIRANGREVPYSLVAAIDPDPASPPSSQSRKGPTTPRPSSSTTGPRRTSR